MPALKKSEVDAYINKYYRSLYGHIKSYCRVRKLEPSEVLSNWYMHLLKTEQKADKKFILSRVGLWYFTQKYFNEKIKLSRNKIKGKNYVFIPKYFESNTNDKIYNEAIIDGFNIEEKIVEKHTIQDLYYKVSKLTTNRYDTHRNIIRNDSPNKKVQQTFYEFMNELPGKGSRQAREQRKKTLIKRLREAYGIKHDSTTNN